jgi:hypothetical protein
MIGRSWVRAPAHPLNSQPNASLTSDDAAVRGASLGSYLCGCVIPQHMDACNVGS